MKAFCSTLVFGLLLVFPAWGEEDTPGGNDAEKKPLELSRVVFQFGGDLFAGPALKGNTLVAGVNASLLVPAWSWAWIGIRPALHFANPEKGEYTQGWFHLDLAAQINVPVEGLRGYGLIGGGYSLAVDQDLYNQVAHGWGALAGAGIAWRAECGWGLFAELAFRLARAENTQRLSPQEEKLTRSFSLTTVTLNLGVEYGNPLAR